MDQQERDRRAARARDLVPALAAAGVAGVAITFVDLSGIARVKAVPLARLEDTAAWGVGTAVVFDTYGIDDLPIPDADLAAAGVPTGAGPVATVGGAVGDLRLMPDLDRLVVLPATPGWAWAPADRFALDGSAHPLDSRLLLGRAVRALAADGLTARAAFEVEFVLATGTDGYGEVVPPTAGAAYGMTRLVETAEVLRDLLSALDGAGVDVGQVHPEYAVGQFEVSVAAEDPLGAADTSVLVRQTIRAVAHRHGLRVSFAPKVGAGVGNGGHVHVSLARYGETQMSGGGGPAGMTATGQAFVAGVLAHLPALQALGAPSVASWLRLVPSHWAGSWAAWGVENRETALRFVQGATGDGGRSANLELKSVDLAANPYLLVAGLLTAGLDGVRSGAVLPDPVGVDPAVLDGPARAAAGVRPLPADLSAAADALAADEVLTGAFGAALTGTLVAHRRAEVRRFAGSTHAEVVAATRWVW